MVARMIRIYGIVQGVGFRPSVDLKAAKHHIAGSVCNKGPYVEVRAKGEEADINVFLLEIKEHSPVRSVILKMDVEEIDMEQIPETSFSIIESEKEEGEIFVSPDIATCDHCKEELFNPSNRRYLHPFINCTQCGPRTTILDGMPYDRIRTSMKEFPMCDACHEEYTSPLSRRYDAQPVCCNDCGPQVYLLHPGQSYDLPIHPSNLPSDEIDRGAITKARRVIANGGIVAVKGIGGFHLCCDATSDAAVSLLRERKKRPMKPFAVMMKDVETAGRECAFLPGQEEILDGHQKPILLLPKKSGGKLSKYIAPDNRSVGVMLPYAPLQMLLFTYDDDVQMPDCLVMTSGNVSGAPIARDDADALKELAHLCDLILSHNRLIRLRADDSVMDYFENQPYMIRRSRGYAPLPFMVEAGSQKSVLAIGSELKNTFCITKNDLCYPSPYIGDMADLRTVKALEESTIRMEHLLEAEPDLVVCDLHPKYNTVAYAKTLDKPLLQVQHHYAHILSCMAENEYLDPVIGLALDGTGYGLDETIWGGELLIADTKEFTRVGSISPFLQVGGDASSKEGWRIAVSMLYGYYQDMNKVKELSKRLGLCDEQTLKVQFMMHDRKINSVMSTSAGRLFDAVSAILGIRNSSGFEGEASMALQYEAQQWADRNDTSELEMCLQPLLEDGRIILPTEDMVIQITERYLAGEEAGALAYLFHKMLAAYLVQAAKQISISSGLKTVACSGGVFQNTLLLGLVKAELEELGFTVLKHSMIPPNDGGIALGQALYGMCKE